MVKSNVLVQQLKSVQASLKEERKPVYQVQQVQKNVQDITQFVKTSLDQQHASAFTNEDQRHIALALGHIHRINKELYSKCRTPHHFEMQSVLFLWMIQRIHELIDAIRFHLQNGFFHIEHEGLTLYNSIDTSWQRVKKIHQQLETSRTWYGIPAKLHLSSAQQSQVKALYQQLETLVKPLLANKHLRDMEHKVTEKEIKSVNQYFVILQKLVKLRENAFWHAFHVKAFYHPSPSSTNEIFAQLAQLEQKINRHDSEGKNSVMAKQTRFSIDHQEELFARINENYIALEPYRFLAERYQMFETLTAKHSKDTAYITQVFFKQLKKELDYFQLFIKTLNELISTLKHISSIFYNLSISFGKINHIAQTNTLVPEFLARAFQTIHGLLQKGLRVADSRQNVATQLQKVIYKAGLFQKNIEGGMLNNLKLLEKAKTIVTDYDEAILKIFNQFSSETPPDMQQSRILLREIYQESQGISLACIEFNNVAWSFSQFLNAMQIINSRYQNLLQIYQVAPDSDECYQKLHQSLQKYAQYSPSTIQSVVESIEELEWFMDDILIDNTEELARFEQELQYHLRAVKIRITQRKKALETQKMDPRLLIRKKRPKENDETESTSATTALATVQKVIPPMIYDPFPRELMDRLIAELDRLESEKAYMLHDAFENVHVFFDYLDRLESDFDPKNPASEAECLEELLESQTAKDFILNFFNFKFSPYGFFDSHGQRYLYNEHEQKFQVPNNSEAYMKFTPRSMETPKGTLRRLLRVMLGFDTPDVLGWSEQNLIELLKEDHILPKDEQAKLKERIPFLP